MKDLLGRPPVGLEHHLVRERLAGRVVLVTGAAGSIGSEMCRQIARFGPATIIGFDNAETGLFLLGGEMREACPEVQFRAEIGNIQNLRRVEEVVGEYLPGLIFHAAAYKHVPMMEGHLFEAVENNVFGTYNVASTAVKFGVGEFVLVSSDKAVRPTSVMGATKRISELIILSLASTDTKFIAVRFGNVLGSNGSVVPLFQRQILAGGPVTVTHPEMQRFFMTIAEASQLVLQASAMGNGGEIFVLDMGDPVKIVDLARNLIALSGLRPDEDIRIEYTGTRPGEKLHEEQSHLGEETVATRHDKVRFFADSAKLLPDMATCLAGLREGCAARDAGAVVRVLQEAIPDYSPSGHVLARARGERGDSA